MRLCGLAVFIVLTSAGAAAQEPERVPPPAPERPELADGVGTETGAGETTAEPPLPRPRPAERERTEPVTAEVPPATRAPPRVYQAACPAVLLGLVEARMVEPLDDDACGERSPLAVTAVLVNGRMVPLSSEAVLNCAMAGALPGWASEIDGYLAARENTRLERVLTGTGYVCRPRNGAAEGPLSEHGFANALDVVGFELEDGRRMTLPEGWSDADAPAGRLLRFAHAAACARFTTTLGPEANALHEDHLHLDLGCHGASCTARLCE